MLLSGGNGKVDINERPFFNGRDDRKYDNRNDNNKDDRKDNRNDGRRDDDKWNNDTEGVVTKPWMFNHSNVSNK